MTESNCGEAQFVGSCLARAPTRGGVGENRSKIKWTQALIQALHKGWSARAGRGRHEPRVILDLKNRSAMRVNRALATARRGIVLPNATPVHSRDASGTLPGALCLCTSIPLKM